MHFKQMLQGNERSADIMMRFVSPYVMKVINTIKMPAWVDKDAVFSDVMLEVWMYLPNFDETRSSLKTYLSMVVKSATHRSLSDHVSECVSIENLDINGKPEDDCDTVKRIRELFAAVPDDEINEESRMLVDRMLRGHTNADIRSEMGWSPAYTGSRVHQMRCHIAWRLVQSGYSAHPWMSDELLHDLALEYEETQRTWF